MPLVSALIVLRDWDLAVAPHGLLGCQDERGEAGQRLGQLQEWVLQTDGQRSAHMKHNKLRNELHFWD